MPKSKIPSPARSQGAITTPRRNKPRRSRSVCSPALSTASGRLTSVIDQFKEKNLESFALSPLNSRLSVLTDNTDIEEPRRKSWWKNLNENSRDVLEVLEENKETDVNNVIEEFVDIEVLSQEKKNHTLDLPDSSDNESINSIVLPQRKLFTQKENQPQKKFGQLVGGRETLAKLHKANTTQHEKTITAGTKELFQGTKRTKPVFPAALLNISPNKTVADKTKENVAVEPKAPVRSIFGNRPANKRKNIFADFIVSESEDEISDIQPKVFGFQKKTEQRRLTSISKGREQSPTSSITVDMELDDWQHLPSSTMVEKQLEIEMVAGHTPVKRARLSKLLENENILEEPEMSPEQSPKKSNKSHNKTNKSLNKSKKGQNRSNRSMNMSTRSQKQQSPKANKIVEESQEKEHQSAQDNIDGIEIGNNEQEMEVVQGNEEQAVELEIQASQKNKTKTMIVEDVEKTEQNTNVINKTSTKDLNVSKKDKTVNKSKVIDNINEQIDDQQIEMEQDEDVGSEDQELKYESDNDQVDNKQELNKTTERHQDDIQGKEINQSKNNQQEISTKQAVENNDSNYIEANVSEEAKETNVDQSEEIQAENYQEMEAEDEPVQEESEQNIEASAEVSAENSGDVDESEEVNAEESREAEDNANESDDEENEIEDEENQEENEEGNESGVLDNEVNENAEMDDDANVSQEVDEEADENVENVDEEGDVSQEINEEGDEGDDQDEEVDENAEQDDEQANVSAEVDNEVNESAVDDEMNESEEENDEAIENADIDKVNESEEVNEQMNESEQEEEAEQSQEIENDQSDDEVDQSQEVESEKENESQNEETNNTSQEIENDGNESQEVENEVESDDENNEQELNDSVDERAASDMSDQEQEMQVDNAESVQQSEDIIDESPNVTHDTTGRNRQKIKSPEVILHDKTNQMNSFIAEGRNSSIRKTKSMFKQSTIRPSLAPARDSLGLSDGARDSSAEGSGWDSHRTTRKTLRQTFGKDFTIRKSLRALVMEKSAKQTENIDLHSETVKFPQANSTEYPEDSNREVNDTVESNHEVSMRTRQTTLETYLQKIKQQNIEKKQQMEQAIRNSLKAPATRDTLSLFKVPSKPPPRRLKPAANKPKKQTKSAILFDELPSEVIEDMKYKPPKRFQPANASWITKRLYKFLETKLEPKYDYKARVRAEKLVETIYHFAKDLRRHDVATPDSVDVLKHELARLDVVKTHFEFYEFFHEYMPREVRVKVVPDVVNKIPLPRHGVFAEILRGNNVQG
ncbi:uncharacterized protein LOC142978128 [Anticarsia gemmatalis]|uniref:uncharacterized protein LOC142978128 n=1 Tax=Anticarsia gemmatalis TaxID=129554 RepID=UPI003F7622DB